MALGTRLRTWAVNTPDSVTMPQVACVEAGHAMLLHIEGHLNPRALAFARTIAADPEHTVVVADERHELVVAVELKRGRAVVVFENGELHGGNLVSRLGGARLS